MILAIDMGSSAFKAAVFTPALERSGSGLAEVAHITNADGTDELDVDATREAAKAAVAGAMNAAGVEGAALTAVAVTSQAQTFTVLDGDGNAACPFITWQDKRAADAAEALSKDEKLRDFARHTSLYAPTPAMQVSHLVRLRRTQSALLDEPNRVCQLGAFVVRELSGVAWTDCNLAAMSGLYSMSADDWWPEALEVCGLTRDQLPMVSAVATSPFATTGCAEAWGLRQGTPIVLAGNDQTAGAYGVELEKTGSILITLGTAQVVYVCCGVMPQPAPGVVRGVYPGRRFYKLVISDIDGMPDALDRLGVDVRQTPVLIAGGGRLSPERVKQLADVLGIPVAATDADPLLGAARMAVRCVH